MTTEPESLTPSRLATLPQLQQWLLLVIPSAALAFLLELAEVPAAFLLGPMICGALAGANGASIRPPQAMFATAQGVIGVMIAASLAPGLFVSFASEWPLILAAVVATVVASSFLGWLISLWKILPGTTGVWGSAPGAATAMVLMADAFGADARLVAFMQYLRVLVVTVTTAVVARLWVDTSAVEEVATAWFPAIEWLPFLSTLAVTAAGVAIGRLLRLPSPNFLGVLILAAVLHLGAGVAFQLPQWLLAASYAFVGWTIGLKFDRQILRHAARALPQVLVSIIALMAFCGALAWLISSELGVDPLTAYLATSPGGMDAVAIIAAASDKVDISFVMALQMMRFLIVLIFGPPLARLVAGWVRR